MGTPETTFWIGMMAVFAAVALLTLWVGSIVSRRTTLVRRLSGGTAQQGLLQGIASSALAPRASAGATAKDARERGELRNQLVLAGYFGADAPSAYRLIRIALTILLPLSLLILFQTSGQSLGAIPKFIGLTVALMLGYFLPDAWLKRRQRLLHGTYRSAFPDLLDLLLVAVDAGLSIEAALERVMGEVKLGQPELAANLAMMSTEMQAGRSTIDALHGLADRLGIEEARSFAVLLQQSVELGSNIGEALRVYSSEMREKRMSRAEERALALPVKIVMPLGAFIFPVILIIILAPVMIRLAKVFNTY